MLKECSQVSTTKILFAKFYVLVCLPRILKRWHTAKKPIFGENVFNAHEFECTRPNMRIWGIYMEGLKDLE